jgi:hypothetical protein
MLNDEFDMHLAGAGTLPKKRRRFRTAVRQCDLLAGIEYEFAHSSALFAIATSCHATGMMILQIRPMMLELVQRANVRRDVCQHQRGCTFLWQAFAGYERST